MKITLERKDLMPMDRDTPAAEVRLCDFGQSACFYYADRVDFEDDGKIFTLKDQKDRLVTDAFGRLHPVRLSPTDMKFVRDLRRRVTGARGSPSADVPGIERLDIKCSHEYVNVGFSHIIMACKHCGTSKEES
jgi:hypothetical protein